MEAVARLQPPDELTMERTERSILVVHLAKRAEHSVLFLEAAGLGDELLDPLLLASTGPLR
jgi:hypothetical protein